VWAAQAGQLQQDIAKCDAKADAFDPAMDPEHVGAGLCEILSVPDATAETTQRSFGLTCGFVTFSPCLIEYRKRVSSEFVSKTVPTTRRIKIPGFLKFGSMTINVPIATPPWIFNFTAANGTLLNRQLSLGGTPRKVIHTSDILVRCEPVAILGVKPTWVCEVGVTEQWALDNQPLNSFPNWIELDPRLEDPGTMQTFKQYLLPGAT
jgi:hypothetical protein